MEPLSMIALGAAVGGAAGKIVERVWDSGENWLRHYFKGHHQSAQDKAKLNSLEFLNFLAYRVQALEEQSHENENFKNKVLTTMDNPQFSNLLQKALLASAKTDNEVKHKILARVVSERLSYDSEELVSLTSELACDAIQYLTPVQLKFLGLSTFILGVKPIMTRNLSKIELSTKYLHWVDHILSFYSPIDPLQVMDFLHMESVSCLRYDIFITKELKKVLSSRAPFLNEDDILYDDFIKNSNYGKELKKIWEQGMKNVTLSTSGLLIGTYVHNEVTNSGTEIAW